MKINKVIVGVYQTNCYILSQNNEVLIIDPGDEFSKIKNAVGKSTVVGILITHRHFDHIGALNDCMKEYKVPVYGYENLEEKEYTIGSFCFSVLFTPGHTQDSIIYHFKKQNYLFTGDFIFQGSIGRMDLGGNEIDMQESIQKLLNYTKDFPEDMELYPGHGPSTTLINERMNNPYL